MSSFNGIRDFYTGKTIFITGSSGFLTKFIIEKILFSCRPSKIYILLSDSTCGKKISQTIINGNNNGTSNCKENGINTININEESVSKYRKKAIFNFRLTKEQRNCLVGIVGSVTLPNLGVTQDDLTKLLNETQIIFHCEETSSLTEPFEIAMDINVTGTLNVLDLASKMKQLSKLVYISSAFTASYTGRIEEQIYTPLIDPLDVLKRIESLDGKSKEININLFDQVKQGHANTFTLTKSFAEYIIKEHSLSKQIPTVIIKPSIVSAPVCEPVPGFIDTFYQGTSDIVATIGLGIQRIFKFDPNNNIPIIPVDYAANAAIIGGSAYVNKNQNPLILGAFNTTSNFITAGTYFDSILRESKIAPSIRSIRLFGRNTYTMNKLSYLVQLFFYNHTFALLYDTYMSFIGNNLRVRGVVSRSASLMETLYAFLSVKWIIEGENLKKQWSQLSNEEQRMFNVDCSYMNWPNYLTMMWHGFRTYTLKETNRDMCTARQTKDHLMHVWLLGKSILVAIILTIFFIVYQPIRSVSYAASRSL